ncbi:MAG: 1-acyl-sn-glycerol-3-phosphate acyltransferase [Bacteroidales bacterium]|jgi:1-acyl-sn-glycerol-3-phosphate acyltransferase|nr:1-acyl-sn-glycerol-3-phosphate acyltransferase [Bacteroidales bacterium]
MKNTLADFNFFYSILRPLVDYGTYNHYRSVTIKGRENLPQHDAYILAPCHQNALMDALLILLIHPRPIAFLARADIFQKKAQAKALNFLRIGPVYRIRDGRDNLSRNDQVFKNSREVLEKGVPLCLMAEGTHNDKHQMLPLVKGMFRIACGTQKELGDKPLYIVPVGLDYDHYEDLYHNVCINIGKPIDVRPFMAEYETNEPVALNQMRQALAEGLGQQMHNVLANEHYDDEYAYCHLKTQETLKELKLKNNPWGRFMARKHISQQLAQLTEEDKLPLYAQGAAFAAEQKQKGVPLWFASKGWTRGKSLLALLAVAFTVWAIAPIWKYWLLSNLIVYLPTHLITKYKIKDPQFRSSVNFGIRLFATFLYMLITFIVFICCKGFWTALGVLLLGFVSIHVTPRIFILLRDVWYGMKG